MERKNAISDLELTSLEIEVYDIIWTLRTQENKSVSNKFLAEQTGISRSRAGRIRKSVMEKLKLPKGF